MKKLIRYIVEALNNFDPWSDYLYHSNFLGRLNKPINGAIYLVEPCKIYQQDYILYVNLSINQDWHNRFKNINKRNDDRDFKSAKLWREGFACKFDKDLSMRKYAGRKLD